MNGTAALTPDADLSRGWTLPTPCNWKVYLENYLEGYHIPIAHPGLFREIDYDQYCVETFRYYSAQHAPVRPLPPGRNIRGRAVPIDHEHTLSQDRFSVKRENGVHHFQRLVAEFMQRENPT